MPQEKPAFFVEFFRNPLTEAYPEVSLMRSMGFFLDSLTFEQYSDVIHDIGGKLFKVIDKSDGVQRFLNRPSIGSRCCLTRDHVLKLDGKPV